MVINLDWIPFIALGIAVLAFAIHHLGPRPVPQQTVYWYRVQRGNPIYALIFSVIAMVGFGLMSLHTASEVKVYRSDPVCAAGLPAVEGTSSTLCRIQTARILDHDTVRGRHGTTYYLDLDLGNGERQRVALDRFSSAFWDGILSEQDRIADVELFRGDVVELETPAGVVQTSSHPAVRNSTYTLMGVIFGGMGVIFALSAAFRNTSPGYAF